MQGVKNREFSPDAWSLARKEHSSGERDLREGIETISESAAAQRQEVVDLFHKGQNVYRKIVKEAER